MKEHTFFGYRLSDLVGTLLMVIPLIISVQEYEVTARVIGFIPWWTRTTRTEVMTQDFITGFLAVAFYCALIVRYGFFRRNRFLEIIISSIKLCLNCWVIASLISVILTTDGSVKLFFGEISNSAFLLIAVILSWIGMKSIAGYSWILFIIMGFFHMQKVNAAMGRWGFVFIVTTALSMLLQVDDYVNINDFMNDFRATTGTRIRGDISAAANDTSNLIKEGIKRLK